MKEERTLAGFVTHRGLRYGLLAFWLVALVVAGGFAGKLSGVQKNDVASSLSGSAESTHVVKLQASFTSSNPLPAVMVYQRPSGLTAADQAKVAADARTFGERKDLNGPVDAPTLAKDGTAAQTVVPLDLGPDYFNKAGDVVKAMRATAEQNANGLTVHIAGPAGSTADSADAVGGADVTLLLATVVVVVAILLITYRSPLLWLLPIVSAASR